IVARRMATVSSKITGKVREVMIEEGQQVRQGDVLATLDPLDADAQRALAAAQVGAARSQIGQVQAQLREAEANASRLQSLAAQQLVSRAQLDQAIAQRDALRAQLTSARRNVAVASEQLDVAAIGVDNTVVRAPFAGVVTAKAAQPGEIVSPISAGGGFTRTGIGTIVDMDSLEVQVDVNEAYIGRVQPGMPVESVLNAYPDWRIPGEVIAIIPTADRAKATVKVRIALDAKDPRIVPDMGVRVSFLEKADADAPRPTGVWVPAKAIVLDGDVAAADAARARKGRVFVVVDGRAVEREVTLAEVRDADRRIAAGVEPGEPVVLEPDELRDGQRVTTGSEAR
ncbi:MAG TPA: efflux RND transporter periplasmic adaptor subunit, partial [Lysobacter sp.]|nr:efflux RND transporter periplasmic adaptor subunit [Lysobacter sp.]